MSKRYSLKELTDMKMRVLWSHIELEGLDVHCSPLNKQITKRSLVKRILAAYAAADVDAAAAGGGAETPAGDVLPENPEFEKLTTPGSAMGGDATNRPDLPADTETPESTQRGGWQPAPT